MRIAVAGGTGLVGRYVVERLKGAGDTPVILTRSAGIDVSNTGSPRKKDAIAFSEAGTAHLLRAGEQAALRRHVLTEIARAC